MKMVPQQYCLRWKHHHTNVQSMFSQLLEKERFCDVTLYCSPSFATQVSNESTVEPQHIRGVSLRAHRVVLAACSELLGALLGAHEAQGEPVLVIDGADPRHVRALLDYMYTGEMNVHHSQLASLLKTAEELRIKGLTDVRWNNKDEPPDCESGVVTTTAPAPVSPKTDRDKERRTPLPPASPPRKDEEVRQEKTNINGGPPPLIKLPPREKSSPIKRETSDTDSPSPKRQRQASGTEHTDDESIKIDREEWQHGNLDISAERVSAWGGQSSRSSDDDWADAPTDIGSFLHTRLRVDGDNSADEESNESGSRGAAPRAERETIVQTQLNALNQKLSVSSSSPSGPPALVGVPKQGPGDPRFADVVKLSDYLQHGRRPQFWEEHYVKRVMEGVRLKELEMKQAAEILGVSYGTLYGRYRDVYGCINRPYRAVRDFWHVKGPAEVLERLQRGEVDLESAARALGVPSTSLAAHLADFGSDSPADVVARVQRGEVAVEAAAGTLGVSVANLAAHVADTHGDFEPIPIEVDPSLKTRGRTYSGCSQSNKLRKIAPAPDKTVYNKKLVIGRLLDEDPIPASVISAVTDKPAAVTGTASSKWPSIRVASLDTLRGGSPSPSPLPPPLPPPADPSQLMRTRPDLTIVAAKPQTDQ